MFAKLWKDESGIVALEYLLLATIVALGLIVGLSNLEGALNAEFSELSNAILALNQGYSVLSQSGCKAFKAGSNATDTAGSVAFGATAVGTNLINVSACFAGSVTTTTAP
jgi:Flp pilus assembly pilin Flp